MKSYPLITINVVILIKCIWCYFIFRLCNNITVVSQAYTVNLVEENVLRGNAAIFKCLIPSFVTEYVAVSSWIISEGDDETEIQSNDLNKEGT